MNCRKGCAACCIAASISSAIPGMLQGKPSGTACIHLTPALECGIYRSPDRPAVCAGLQPSEEMCGANAQEAYDYLMHLDRMTDPTLENQ